MSAWDKLLAASQLAVGTAWELITNPKTGTSAPETIYVQEISSVVEHEDISSTTTDSIISTTVVNDKLIRVSATIEAQVNTPDDTMVVEIK